MGFQYGEAPRYLSNKPFGYRRNTHCIFSNLVKRIVYTLSRGRLSWLHWIVWRIPGLCYATAGVAYSAGTGSAEWHEVPFPHQPLCRKRRRSRDFATPFLSPTGRRVCLRWRTSGVPRSFSLEQSASSEIDPRPWAEIEKTALLYSWPTMQDYCALMSNIVLTRYIK